MKNIKLFTGISFTLDFIAILLIGVMFFGDYVYQGVLHDIANLLQNLTETPGLTVEIFLPFIFILNFVIALWATTLAFQQKQLKTRSIFSLIVSILFFIPAVFYIMAWRGWSG